MESRQSDSSLSAQEEDLDDMPIMFFDLANFNSIESAISAALRNQEQPPVINPAPAPALTLDGEEKLIDKSELLETKEEDKLHTLQDELNKDKRNWLTTLRAYMSIEVGTI